MRGYLIGGILYYKVMLRAWERGRPARMLQEPFQIRAWVLFLLRF